MKNKWLNKSRKKIIIAIIIVGFIFTVLTPLTFNISWDFWEKISYPGIFLLSFIGASSIIIPIPYTVILFALSPSFDPILLTLFAGFGSAMGELVGYAIGYFGRNVLGGKRRRQMDAMQKIFKRFGMLAVFLFALTPLPDDLIFIPFGLMRYSFWRTFAAGLAGKLLMLFIIANIGKAAGELFLLDEFFAVAITILLVLVIVAIFKTDWVKLAERYAEGC